MGIRTTACRLPLGLSFVAAVAGSLQTPVRAEIRVAAALTPEAVWDAIDAANDGDVVRLPAGTAVWKRGWNCGHWMKMKAIMIQGAGIDETIIRTDTTTAPGDKSFVLNGAKLNMVLRPWANHEREAKQAEHVKEGRDFFNEKARPEYYRP